MVLLLCHKHSKKTKKIIIANALPTGKLFKKVGEKEWEAWVPFITSYTRTKVIFGEKRAWWFLIDFLIGGLFEMYVAYNEARAFDRKPVFAHVPSTYYNMDFVVD